MHSQPFLQSAPHAPDGSVRTLHSYTPADFPPTAAILCRCTAPLVAFALDLLSRNVACTIAGRDLAGSLASLVEKMKATNMTEFRDRLFDYRREETQKLRRKGKEAQAEALFDRCVAVEILSKGCTSPGEIKARIEDLFRAGPGVLLSTVHRAKGREWETVFILDFDLMPAPWASEDELEQEHNLIYVAQTRAIRDLRYITSGGWEK